MNLPELRDMAKKIPCPGRPAQPRFDLSYRRQALINYKPEQRVIDTIVELKSQGMSLRQIARTLSKLKIPTKLSGVAWHPMMVKRVLDYLAKQAVDVKQDKK